MPLFGSKDKKTRTSVDSQSKGNTAPKAEQSGKHDLIGNKPTAPTPATNLPVRSVQQTGSTDNTPKQVVSPVSSKNFAAELDSSTISSLPPSHRDGGSVSGSQPTRTASTTGTSVTSPTDQSQKELVLPDQVEKQVAGGDGLIHDSKISGSSGLIPNNASDLPEVDKGGEAGRIDSSQKEVSGPGERMNSFQKEVGISGQPEATVFSMPLSATSTSARSFREYTFYNCNNFKDMVICDPSQRSVLFAEIFSHTRSKSDVIIHDLTKVPSLPPAKNITAKEAVNGLVVAFADYVPNEMASQIRLGIGSPLDPAACTWVMMKNIQRDANSGAEKFDMTVSRAGSTDLTFQWSRNATNDSDPSDESSAKEAYRLTQDDEAVASFRHAGAANMRKRGSLRVYEVPMAEQYLLLIMLSASAMSEMYRRRRSKKIRKSFLIPF